MLVVPLLDEFAQLLDQEWSQNQQVLEWFSQPDAAQANLGWLLDRCIGVLICQADDRRPGSLWDRATHVLYFALLGATPEQRRMVFVSALHNLHQPNLPQSLLDVWAHVMTLLRRIAPGDFSWAELLAQLTSRPDTSEVTSSVIAGLSNVLQRQPSAVPESDASSVLQCVLLALRSSDPSTPAAANACACLTVLASRIADKNLASEVTQALLPLLAHRQILALTLLQRITLLYPDAVLQHVHALEAPLLLVLDVPEPRQLRADDYALLCAALRAWSALLACSPPRSEHPKHGGARCCCCAHPAAPTYEVQRRLDFLPDDQMSCSVGADTSGNTSGSTVDWVRGVCNSSGGSSHGNSVISSASAPTHSPKVRSELVSLAHCLLGYLQRLYHGVYDDTAAACVLDEAEAVFARAAMVLDRQAAPWMRQTVLRYIEDPQDSQHEPACDVLAAMLAQDSLADPDWLQPLLALLPRGSPAAARALRCLITSPASDLIDIHQVVVAVAEALIAAPTVESADLLALVVRNAGASPPLAPRIAMLTLDLVACAATTAASPTLMDTATHIYAAVADVLRVHGAAAVSQDLLAVVAARAVVVHTPALRAAMLRVLAAALTHAESAQRLDLVLACIEQAAVAAAAVPASEDGAMSGSADDAFDDYISAAGLAGVHAARLATPAMLQRLLPHPLLDLLSHVLPSRPHSVASALCVLAGSQRASTTLDLGWFWPQLAELISNAATPEPVLLDTLDALSDLAACVSDADAASLLHNVLPPVLDLAMARDTRTVPVCVAALHAVSCIAFARGVATALRSYTRQLESLWDAYGRAVELEAMPTMLHAPLLLLSGLLCVLGLASSTSFSLPCVVDRLLSVVKARHDTADVQGSSDTTLEVAGAACYALEQYVPHARQHDLDMLHQECQALAEALTACLQSPFPVVVERATMCVAALASQSLWTSVPVVVCDMFTSWLLAWEYCLGDDHHAAMRAKVVFELHHWIVRARDEIVTPATAEDILTAVAFALRSINVKNIATSTSEALVSPSTPAMSHRAHRLPPPLSPSPATSSASLATPSSVSSSVSEPSPAEAAVMVHAPCHWSTGTDADVYRVCSSIVLAVKHTVGDQVDYQLVDAYV